MDPITESILNEDSKNIALGQFRKAFPHLNKRAAVVFNSSEKRKIKKWWKTTGIDICNKRSKTQKEKGECLKFVKTQT